MHTKYLRTTGRLLPIYYCFSEEHLAIRGFFSQCNGLPWCEGSLKKWMKLPAKNQLSGGISQANPAPRQNQLDEATPRLQYSIPGILHFIQHEWARFEMERSQWELEKAELQVSLHGKPFYLYITAVFVAVLSTL